MCLFIDADVFILFSETGLTPLENELKKCRSEYTLVVIMQMRLARRSEGIARARGFFSKARRDKWVSWEAYEASGGCNFSFFPPIR
jgi:hypothetical protein